MAISFDIDEIPFSYHGSWFNLSRVVGKARYADHVHLVSHQTGLNAVLQLVPWTHRLGTRVDAEIRVTPATFAWVVPSGRIEVAYETVDVLRIRGVGLGLSIRAADNTLTPFSGPFFYRDPRDGAFVFTTYETGRRYRVTVLTGTVADVVGAGELGSSDRGLNLPDGEAWEIAIEEYATSRRPYVRSRDFDDVVAAVSSDFEAFAERVAPFRGPEHPAAELAAYTIWSATVRPAGFLTRPSVLMSKHWMDKVWSWDHCFNAIALGRGEPELAWDQFFGVFDHQDESGALPDSVTHSETLYNFVKPPIHGWAFERLRRRVERPLRIDELQVAYDRLSAWTRFWLDHRRAPGHALPYYQHGNDSGWDNATTFADERLVETGDLAAFLVLQLRTLAGLANELGRADDEQLWVEEEVAVRTALFEQLWSGNRFVARSVTGAASWTGASLLDLLPIVLGENLPIEIGEELALQIQAQLAPSGLATEQISSALYEADGYWRGPVWAPSTVLVEDGLRRAGYDELADEVSARFRELCEKSGFAENFDAVTGAGLRDRAYTWTASAYLVLCAEAQQRSAGRSPVDSDYGK